jgi:hypothetical protein
VPTEEAPGPDAPLPFFVPESIELRAGEVLSDALRVWGKNLGVLGALGVLAFLPIIVWSLLAPKEDPVFTVGAMSYGSLARLFVAGAVTQEVREAMRGKPIRLPVSIRTGLKFIPGVLAVSLLDSFGVGAGALLLIIPGIVLFVSWAVVVPALVAERTGVWLAFPRSSELTSGYRLTVFGVLILTATIVAIPSGIVGVITVIGGPVMRAIGEGATGLITTLSSVTTAVLYHRLRALKDGPEASELADVFR